MRRHGVRSFDDFALLLAQRSAHHEYTYSQFNLLGTYMWHHERARYDFHIEGFKSRRGAGDPPDPPDVLQPMMELGNHYSSHGADRWAVARVEDSCHASAYGRRDCAKYRGRLNPGLFVFARVPVLYGERPVADCRWCEAMETAEHPAAAMQRAHHAAAWPSATQRLRPDRDCVVLPTEDWDTHAYRSRCRFAPPPLAELTAETPSGP